MHNFNNEKHFEIPWTPTKSGKGVSVHLVPPPPPPPKNAPQIIVRKIFQNLLGSSL